MPKRKIEATLYGQGTSRDMEYIESRTPGNLLGSVIPKPLQPPKRIQVNSWSIIVMGLKTDSRNKITEIACTDMKGPRKNFYLDVDSSSATLKEGLKKFIGHLPKQTILMSHDDDFSKSNSLIQNVINLSLMSLLKDKVVAFSNSYDVFGYKLKPLFKQHFKDVKYTTHFSSTLLRETYNLAELICDKRVSKVVNLDIICRSSRTVDCALEEKLYDEKVNGHLATLRDLIHGAYLTQEMAERIARSGLGLCHIEYAFQKAGFEGLKELLNPRVTKDNRVLHKAVLSFSLFLGGVMMTLLLVLNAVELIWNCVGDNGDWVLRLCVRDKE